MFLHHISNDLSLGPGSAVGQEFSEGVEMGEEGGGGAWRHAFHIADPP